MSLSSVLHNMFKWVHSDKISHVVDEVAKVVPIALPIVKQIGVIAGDNRTVASVTAAFEKFGVPYIAEAQVDLGAALLHLATEVVTKEVPAGTAKNIIQTGISFAVSADKADPNTTTI